MLLLAMLAGALPVLLLQAHVTFQSLELLEVLVQDPASQLLGTAAAARASLLETVA